MSLAYQTPPTGTSSAQDDGVLACAQDLLCMRGGRILFSPIGFTVARGGSLLLRGPNGAGKSSLIRMIAGLLPVGAGGLDVPTRLAMSDENIAMDTGMTLNDALGFWARLDGAGAAAVTGALEQFALAPLRDIPVRMLSTGQRKRAMLARVAASGAPLWLLDEPGNGLDTGSLALLGAAMQAHVARGGGIIAASHFPLPFAFTQEIELHPALPPADGEDEW